MVLIVLYSFLTDVPLTSNAKESDRGPTGEVREDEECHAFGDGEVGAGEGGHGVLAPPDGAVHPAVAGTDDGEGEPVEQQEGGQVRHVQGSKVFQGQADAGTTKCDVSVN